MTAVLVINTGSSSIKYELFAMPAGLSKAAGILERIGEPQSSLSHREPAGESFTRAVAAADHRQAMQQIMETLMQRRTSPLEAPTALGHRVVHGGEVFREPARVDSALIQRLRELIRLAPLHNPANIVGMEVALEIFPQVPQVAVFDTAFHHTIPPHAARYAIPEHYYQQYHVRRYGFHGTSHAFVARQAALFLQRPIESLKFITLHLGNGASAAAVDGGRCVDTSMGMTPLEGLIMGTRSGDLDPAILPYLVRTAGLTIDQLDAALNKQSGLKGICGENDMREVLRRAAAGDAASQLARDMYAYRIKKYIGAYLAVLGGADAIIFTAGIGENAAEIRAAACDGLQRLGIVLDPLRNASAAEGVREINAPDSATRILVVPTDEELEIARQTWGCLGLG